MRKYIIYVKRHTAEVFGLLLIAFVLFLFAVSTRGEHFTQQFFDGVRTTSTREDIIIVGIDDKSLQEIGAWPWKRNIFSELTKKLNEYEARAVIYDVLFLEPREGDNDFKNALSKIQTPVILASKIEKNSYLQSFFTQIPNPNIISALSNVYPDVDGKVRKYPLPVVENEACLYGLGEQSFRVITFAKKGGCVEKEYGYFRYPVSITTYSLVDIINGKINSQKLKNKVVLIGSTSLDLEDHFVGMSGEKIPGVQVHASILTSLLNKEGDRVLGDAETALLIILFIVTTLLLFHFIKSLFGQTVVIVFTIISIVLIAYVLFLNHIIIPVVVLILSVILSGGFSTIIRYIKERKKSEHISTLFSKYVHKDVLRELMKSPESLNLTGEKRYLTVLFSDLRGFTTLSESLSPEDLTKILNGYFSAMTPAILEEHGTIDKYIGDAIMAFWNAPLDVEDHEMHAVLSALRMQEALLKFNKENNSSLAVGIGIHSGSAVVGNVGSQERVNYTVLGDTVNLASRVESLTKKYGVEILVTEEVKNKVDDKGILFRKLDVITVKGKSEPTVLYEAMITEKNRIEIVKDYEIAFLEYQSGDFEEAKILFKALGDRGDIPSKKMYERISEMKEVDNWDGIWHFDDK
ncbi:adenylate/guanylate cyclase domain-containing protein [Candidatus Gracilibacteria bacterium]|nr:adenylate/guanylate cyclase domain-containing protein [Candidatus Gracilibacteria bacterium]MCF7898940.1 adenylate/guanylate cyclase domain-containing protein [Candidatus Paceibacterota bacterium]